MRRPKDAHIGNPAARVRPRRGRYAFRLMAAALMAVLRSSCFWTYNTPTNTVVAGNGVYFYFKKYATDDIQGLYAGNSNNANATLNTMEDIALSTYLASTWKKAGYYISDFDYFFHNDNNSDFATAMSDVRAPQRCLIMHRNLNPIGDRHNWTFREDADRYCIVGSHFG